MRAVLDKAARGSYPRAHLYADLAPDAKALCGRAMPKRPSILSEEKTAEGLAHTYGEIRTGGYSTTHLCGSCRKAHDPPPAAAKMRLADMKALHARAVQAADAAFDAAVPRPMMVYTPKNMMASLTGGDDGGPDPDQPVYHVPEGVCGFAWVTVRPGNSRFALFIKREAGGRTGYRGGMETWDFVSGDRLYTQSLARKEAGANAYAAVLREAGINAYSGSRLD